MVAQWWRGALLGVAVFLFPRGFDMLGIESPWVGAFYVTLSVAAGYVLMATLPQVNIRYPHKTGRIVLGVVIVGAVAVATMGWNISQSPNDSNEETVLFNHEIWTSKATPNEMIVEMWVTGESLSPYDVAVVTTPSYKEVNVYSCSDGTPPERSIIAAVNTRENRTPPGFTATYISPILGNDLRLCLHFRADEPMEVEQLILTR